LGMVICKLDVMSYAKHFDYWMWMLMQTGWTELCTVYIAQR